MLQAEAAHAWSGHVRVLLGGDSSRAVLKDVKHAMVCFAPAASDHEHTSRITQDGLALGKCGLRTLAADAAEIDRVCLLTH